MKNIIDYDDIDSDRSVEVHNIDGLEWSGEWVSGLRPQEIARDSKDHVLGYGDYVGDA